MASSTTSNVYVNVIEDVINKIREEFVNNSGPGESVLNELQGVITSSSFSFYFFHFLSVVKHTVLDMFIGLLSIICILILMGTWN